MLADQFGGVTFVKVTGYVIDEAPKGWLTLDTLSDLANGVDDCGVVAVEVVTDDRIAGAD